jgi:hypothetical protein
LKPSVGQVEAEASPWQQRIEGLFCQGSRIALDLTYGIFIQYHRS